ncbi:MAG: peptidoglycan-binding protein [Clostridia bacterium]|nr:peptidoglycan-binding protein [Clostridia bacterium]
MLTPKVPETIVVHLGAPNQPAENVTVPFSDYIKNVASSELYPTWPENALRANIYAIVSFTLNRVYTEFYRSQGYDFDITSTTQYDQKFIKGRDIFGSVNTLVDELFNDYVTKGDQIQPYFTTYCSGTTVTCDGLSQWGTVTLARQGLTPLQILQYYYGDDIQIVENAPITANVKSYPGVLFRLGSFGDEVLDIQRELNRIAANYPSIPRIPETNGIFDQPTHRAVEQFQRIFNLPVDGVVGKGTWYKLKQIYNGVKRLSELYSEGITLTETQQVYRSALRYGDRGTDVGIVQYYLSFIGRFYDTIPVIAIDSIFGSETRDAVYAFQNQFGLTVDGVVGRQTWYALQDEYDRILRSLPEEYMTYSSLLYPGYFITTGASGKVVEQVQTMLQVIAEGDGDVPMITVDGVYGAQTMAAVKTVQRLNGLPETGYVGPLTWNAIVNLFNQYRSF